MKSNHLQGTGVALVTPFNEDLSIDFNSLGNIINHTLAGGVDFFVVLGTTGESALLTPQERKEVVDFVKKQVAGRVPLVLGYGGICTSVLVEGFKHLELDGIDAILTVTPFYVKPSQKGLMEHYNAIADASPVPVILYNVPGRTGVNLEASTTVKLASHPNIIGVKEASGKLFQTEEILLNRPEGFLLYSGEDALTYHLMNLGADGVISVVANAYPKEVSVIVRREHNGAVPDATQAHFSLKVLTKAVFAEGNPCGIKYVMSKMGLCKNVVRLPLVPISQATRDIIDREME